MRSGWASVLVPAVALSAFTLVAVARPQSETADARLDRALEQLVAVNGGPPGIAVVVQRDQDAQFHTAGVADVAAMKVARIDDHSRLASVSKAFSGAAALAQVSKGVLSLDDTIGKWLPHLPAQWAPVTLAQLLGHTSGISDYTESKAFADAFLASLLVAPPPVHLLSYAAADLRFTPGSRYEYSNSDNIIAGLMVEAATGRTYESTLKRDVFVPLKLHRTSLPASATMPRSFIHGYDIDPALPPDDVSEIAAPGWAWASGGMVSTPGDANLFVRGYASGATIDAATRARQLSFRRGRSDPPGPGTNSAGLAIFEYRTSCGTVYGHTGNIFGYTEFVAASPDGTRSTSVSVNAQVTPSMNKRLFPKLRKIFKLAVCAALA